MDRRSFCGGGVFFSVGIHNLFELISTLFAFGQLSRFFKRVAFILFFWLTFSFLPLGCLCTTQSCSRTGNDFSFFSFFF
uniref:Uncharacterized protein n=1 Tax=Anguilla anguilla TaxID=7936 RepID=A0A0E9WR52_ANGAN